MALKNDETISNFGQRLCALMEEKEISSPKELAKKLYMRKLVHVKTRNNDNSPERDRDNAILSIEKKIVRHIKTGVISDQNGEFVLAYSSFFGCSTDFILGLTDIRTPNYETRYICELLGINENVVTELIRCNQEKDNPVPACWSLLMGSHLLYSLPEDMILMGTELQRMYQHEGELNALKWECDKVSGPDLMDLRLDMEGHKQGINSSRSAFYRMLSKTSRNIENMIEQYLLSRYEIFRERFAACMLEEARKRHDN